MGKNKNKEIDNLDIPKTHKESLKKFSSDVLPQMSDEIKESIEKNFIIDIDAGKQIAERIAEKQLSEEVLDRLEKRIVTALYTKVIKLLKNKPKK